GRSRSGPDGFAECGGVTPGAAPEKRLVNLLATEGELSDEPTLAASEQPDSIAAPTISPAARRRPRPRSQFPGPIEITRLFPTTCLLRSLYQPIRGDPKATGAD